MEDILLRPLLVIQQLSPEFIRILKSSLTVAADGCSISVLPENPPDGTVIDPCDIPHGLAIFSAGEGGKDMWFYLWRGLFEEVMIGMLPPGSTENRCSVASLYSLNVQDDLKSSSEYSGSTFSSGTSMEN